MARVATMVMQTIWDCRWSRPGYIPNRIATSEHPSSRWVCVRPTATTVRRPVTERSARPARTGRRRSPKKRTDGKAARACRVTTEPTAVQSDAECVRFDRS
jgi:hypothetical protein